MIKKPADSAGVILLATLIVTLALPVAAERLDSNVFPTFQSIHLHLNADSANYSGVVRIDITVKTATNTFQLHAEEMELLSVTLTDSEEKGNIALTHEITGDKGMITVSSSTELAPGDYQLTISFSNNFNTQANSLYRLDHDSSGYSFTQYEDDEAREAFPCWDEPSYKIPWQMTLTVPEHHQAISNTPFSREIFSDGQKTVIFEKTPPMPSYLLATATGLLEYVEIPGTSIPARVVCVAGRKHLAGYAVEVTPSILAELERYFGGRYPYRKLDLIAVPEFTYGAMENPGAIVYRETLLLLDPEKSSISQKRRVVEVTAHELAHIWYGDLVTMTWWDDLWLNEAFAEWMGNKVAAELFPQFNTKLNRARVHSGTMNSDARPSAKAIYQPVSDPDLVGNIGAIYSKGEAALQMIESWLGEETFRQGVLLYLKEHEWGSAVAADLWAGLSQASGKDVAKVMGPFINQPGVPLVEIEIALDGALTLTQSRFSNYGVEFSQESLWSIPVVLKYYDGSTVRDTAIFLTERTQTMKLESDGQLRWILPNPGTVGYYRWKLPPEMIKAIADKAKADKAAEFLTARERVGFLDNLSALLDAGEVSGEDYLRSLTNFGEDADASVISAVITGLGKAHTAFVSDDLQDKFAIYLRQTLSPALKRFGVEPVAGEDETISTMRPQLLALLAGRGNHSATLAHCEKLAKLYLENPLAVDPSLSGTALNVSARRGDSAMFAEYRSRFENANDPAERAKFLKALGGFQDRQIQTEALNYVLSGPLRAQELLSIPRAVATVSSENTDLVFTWLRDHYDEITSRIPPYYLSYLPYFGSGCSLDRLTLAQKFFRDEQRVSASIEQRLEQIADQVTDCASLREREGSAVTAYLNMIAGESPATD